MEFVEIVLVLLVDGRRGCFESLPEPFAQVTSHRTDFSPLFVELLQGAAGLDYIVVVLQAFGCFAEKSLGLQIFLEIQVTQFDVDLDQIVELLLVLLIGFAQFLHFLGRHRSDSFPLSLQFAHAFEIVHNIGRLGFCESFHHIEDSLLLRQVLCLLFRLLSSHFGAFSLILVEQSLELLLECIYLRLNSISNRIGCLGNGICRFVHGVLCRLDLFVILAVELGFQVFHLVFNCRYILVQQSLEVFNQFFSCACHKSVFLLFSLQRYNKFCIYANFLSKKVEVHPFMSRDCLDKVSVIK